MYTLTNDQKIANLQELRANYVRKKNNLENMIQDVDTKIAKLKGAKASNGSSKNVDALESLTRRSTTVQNKNLPATEGME